MGCPILWKSQLQTESALSEYTGLSYTSQEAILLLRFLNEMVTSGFPVAPPNAHIQCHMFADNSGAKHTNLVPEQNT